MFEIIHQTSGTKFCVSLKVTRMYVNPGGASIIDLVQVKAKMHYHVYPMFSS